MTRDLFLARHLLEAVVDPDGSIAQIDNAASELAQFNARFGIEAGHGFPVGNFAQIRAADFSPSVWLYLLESRGKEDEEIPYAILEEVFLECSDGAVRFRLVSGALAQPGTQARYLATLGDDSKPPTLSALPPSWPKQRIEMLEAGAASSTVADDTDARTALTELVLYLLQDGSKAALALAAAAISPFEEWRAPARELAWNVVLTVDPELAGYGRLFRHLFGS